MQREGRGAARRRRNIYHRGRAREGGKRENGAGRERGRSEGGVGEKDIAARYCCRCPNLIAFHNIPSQTAPIIPSKIFPAVSRNRTTFSSGQGDEGGSSSRIDGRGQTAHVDGHIAQDAL